MTAARPKITICIPHWQVQLYMTLCLRSICKHSRKYDLEVIVVDNGSKDDSLDYLRGLDWIRLIERPEEVHTNWPGNVFTAWDRGLREATGDYYVTMHSDVFIKSDDWLDPFIREIEAGDNVAASGAWKLEIENPLYVWQKRLIGYAVGKSRSVLRLGKQVNWQKHNYPRDYCAMYRPAPILEHGLTFDSVNGSLGGGLSIARQLWAAGHEMRVFPVHEMARHVYHVAHGTAAVIPIKRLNRERKQRQIERKLAKLLKADWIEALRVDQTLDGSLAAALRPRSAGVNGRAACHEIAEMADEFRDVDSFGKHEPLAQLQLAVERLDR